MTHSAIYSVYPYLLYHVQSTSWGGLCCKESWAHTICKKRGSALKWTSSNCCWLAYLKMWYYSLNKSKPTSTFTWRFLWSLLLKCRASERANAEFNLHWLLSWSEKILLRAAVPSCVEPKEHSLDVNESHPWKNKSLIQLGLNLIAYTRIICAGNNRSWASHIILRLLALTPVKTDSSTFAHHFPCSSPGMSTLHSPSDASTPHPLQLTILWNESYAISSLHITYAVIATCTLSLFQTPACKFQLLHSQFKTSPRFPSCTQCFSSPKAPPDTHFYSVLQLPSLLLGHMLCD